MSPNHRQEFGGAGHSAEALALALCSIWYPLCPAGTLNPAICLSVPRSDQGDCLAQPQFIGWALGARGLGSQIKEKFFCGPRLGMNWGLGVGDWGQWRHGVHFGESVCIHGTQEVQWRGLHVCPCTRVRSDKLCLT